VTPTLETLVLEAGRALAPLEERLRAGEVRLLFAEIGMPAPETVLAVEGVEDAVEAAADAVGRLPDALGELGEAIEAGDAIRIGAALGEAMPLVEAVAGAVDTLSARVREVAGSAGPGAAEVEAFAAELAERLFGFALAGYLDEQRPVIGHLFTLLGVIEAVPVAATPATPAHVRRALRLDRLSALVDDPVAVLAELYGWGRPEFDWDVLLRRLSAFLGRVSDFSFVQPGPPPFLRIAAVDIGPTDDPVPGVQAVLRVQSDAGLDLTLPLGQAIALTAAADAALELGAAVELMPPADLRLVPRTTEVEGSVRAGFQAPAAPGTAPVVVLGAAGGSRVEGRRVRAGAGADLGWSIVAGRAEGAFVLEAAVEGGIVVLSLEGADGFLTAILPSRTLELEVDVLVRWSSATGFHVEGSAGLEADLPVDLDLGPVKVQQLHVGLAAAGTGLALELSGALGARLGPVAMAVDRLGTIARLSFDGGGNLGPADLALDFKPPQGIGLSIDAAIVRGGGFVRLDPDRGEYAGVLELALGPVTVKAIAILTTRLPDGRPGWALLMVVFSEFRAIQLGFGFTLNGVGGIVGLQHGVSTAELQAGMRTGALDYVLFPPDPVANAPLLLGQLRLVFPIVPRALTVGPALRIGWSRPPILTANLGLVLQIDDAMAAGGAQPQLSRVVLVGRLEVILPPGLAPGDPELVKLLVDVVGSYEVREQALSVDARLRDSHVAGLPLTGSLVVRARFGERPSLIVAVGGFHPRFRDLPPGLPAQDRVTFELSHEIVTVRIAGYLALTSNTLQVGADAQLKAAGAGFTIEAALGFDALFETEPVFAFEIDFRVSASIRWHGRRLASVQVSGVLRGPGRWEVSGRASFSILFWDVDIGFELAWGRVAAALTAAVAVGAELVAALADRANWAAELPLGGNALVTLAASPRARGTVAAHPLGELSVVQKVVPLGVDISRVGTARPSDGTRFDITTVALAGRDTGPPRFREEHFARGRYLDLDPEEKLSTPSFERFRAGVTISTSAFTVASDQVAFDPDFETVYLGDEPPEPQRGDVLPSLILTAQGVFGAASYSALRRDERLVPRDEITRVRVLEPTFVTVDRALAAVGAPLPSYTEASQLARREGTLVADPAELAEAP
jgi:hypothetical protein